jgi:GT2 family glycosyltransferase
MIDPAITVAVSTRNRADALGRCLGSLRSGARPPDEIVVVDQSDGSASRAIVEHGRGIGLTITYIRDDARGLGAAQNLAFQAATHDLVAVLDDDCIAHADWVRVLASVLAARSDLDGVTGRVLPLPATESRTFAVSSRTSDVRREFSGRALPWEVGSGNNFALRRAAFLRVGGCDERLGPGARAQGGVDMDLFHRLLRAGSRILYEPDAIVYHERQTRDERRARRPMYGRGMGAAIAIWHRERDQSSRRILGSWIKLRLRQMRMAAARGDWADVGDEVTMLASTMRGLAQGWRLGADSRSSVFGDDR